MRLIQAKEVPQIIYVELVALVTYPARLRVGVVTRVVLWLGPLRGIGVNERGYAPRRKWAG